MCITPRKVIQESKINKRSLAGVLAIATTNKSGIIPSWSAGVQCLSSDKHARFLIFHMDIDAMKNFIVGIDRTTKEMAVVAAIIWTCVIMVKVISHPDTDFQTSRQTIGELRSGSYM